MYPPIRTAVTKAVIMLWVREDFLGSDPTSQSDGGAFGPIIIKCHAFALPHAACVSKVPVHLVWSIHTPSIKFSWTYIR